MMGKLLARSGTLVFNYFAVLSSPLWIIPVFIVDIYINYPAMRECFVSGKKSILEVLR